MIRQIVAIALIALAGCDRDTEFSRAKRIEREGVVMRVCPGGVLAILGPDERLHLLVVQGSSRYSFMLPEGTTSAQVCGCAP